MAHQVETMAYAGELPWHGLGVKVDDCLSPMEMLAKAGLDWTVEKHDQFIEIDGEKIKTGQKALVRSKDNSILTYVSDGWNPVQNDTAFDFFNEFVEAGGMKMHTAGSLQGGKKVWGLAKLNEDFAILNGQDAIETYLLLSNPHEYGKSIDVRLTPIRVVCNNTLTLALNGKSDLMVRLNHSKEFDAEFVKRTLGLAHTKTETYKEACDFLTTQRFTVDSVKQYFMQVFDSESKSESNDNMGRIAHKVYNLMDSQPGANLGQGTWWQAVNAVTYATDHVLGRSNDTRLTSAWYGPNRQRKLDAFNLALDYAKAA